MGMPLFQECPLRGIPLYFYHANPLACNDAIGFRKLMGNYYRSQYISNIPPSSLLLKVVEGKDEEKKVIACKQPQYTVLSTVVLATICEHNRQSIICIGRQHVQLKHYQSADCYTLNAIYHVHACSHCTDQYMHI